MYTDMAEAFANNLVPIQNKFKKLIESMNAANEPDRESESLQERNNLRIPCCISMPSSFLFSPLS